MMNSMMNQMPMTRKQMNKFCLWLTAIGSVGLIPAPETRPSNAIDTEKEVAAKEQVPSFDAIDNQDKKAAS